MGWAYARLQAPKRTAEAQSKFSALKSFRTGARKPLFIATEHAALLAERDALQQALIEHTKRLEELQLSRNLELERFAEFGRLSANLIHEIASPLTAATLSLEAAGDYDNPFVKRAQQNLRHLERYMQAARQQLQGHSSKVDFSIRHEVERIKLVVNPLAQRSHVSIIYDIDRSAMLHGDPIKFNQILANLLANAVDAYENVTAPIGNKRIVLETVLRSTDCIVRVRDWGCGIEDDQLEHVFEPFYTTKQQHQHRGMGIGLSMVKQITEQDFGGTILATSSPQLGTIFSLTFPMK